MLPRQKRSTAPCATIGSLVNLVSDCVLPFYFFIIPFVSFGLACCTAGDDHCRKSRISPPTAVRRWWMCSSIQPSRWLSCRKRAHLATVIGLTRVQTETETLDHVPARRVHGCQPTRGSSSSSHLIRPDGLNSIQVLDDRCIWDLIYTDEHPQIRGPECCAQSIRASISWCM